MAELFSFSPGRRALVTGGASGLGLGAARRLIDVGAAVAVADLPAALDRFGEDKTFIRIPMDVTEEASVAAGVGAAAAKLGGLDTLVNSAGIFQFRRLEEITTAEWDRILDVNLRGTFLVYARGDAPSEGVRPRAGGEHLLRCRQDGLSAARPPIAPRNSPSSA